ncbi:MAG: alanine--tRNA ligase-related protein [Candidatus Paceibacterota bacterium]|jgi:alanyl-tRNA synthetase
MQSHEIRRRFLTFFEKRGHTVIPSASLIPENDPSVLFNTAGMQPLVPYLLGASHPSGATRLANSQKCIRTVDIDEIGDNTHATFFEMLGNWSLGDYFKEEAVKWSFEFLTDKEEGLGLDASRLYVTVFEGDENAPRDNKSYNIWKKLFEEKGITGERIYFMSAKSNWWSAGEVGPCGPDTEMFYDVTGKITEGMTKEEYMKADDEQKVVEIWNDVFMEFKKKVKDDKLEEYAKLKFENKPIPSWFYEYPKLPKQNVDTGSGLERILMVVNGVDNIYETDLLAPIVAKVKNQKSKVESTTNDGRAERIIADHVRTSVFMIADGVTPSNTDRGYILRRLLRRAVRLSHSLGMEGGLETLVGTVVQIYKDAYPNLLADVVRIREEIKKEEEKFRLTLERGMKEFEKIEWMGFPTEDIANLKKGSFLGEAKPVLSGKIVFDLYQTFGFPIEVTKELAKEKGISIDEKGFEAEFKKHKEISAVGSEQKFKGGLADTSEISTRYHTATHLLQKALQVVLGEHVHQKGSNITAERMRFDFSHGEKMTDEQKKRVEDLVNEKIKEALPVKYEDLPIEEARKTGAMGLFGDKYGEIVRVYTIGEGDKKWSRELCGGPHVKNTAELGHFKIVKEEAVSAGVRRIKAVIE